MITCNNILLGWSELGFGALLGLVRTLLCSEWYSLSSSCWFNKVFNILCFCFPESLLELSWLSSLPLAPLVNKFLSLPDSVDTTLFWVSTLGVLGALLPCMVPLVVGHPLESSILLQLEEDPPPFALRLTLMLLLGPAMLFSCICDSWTGLKGNELLKGWPGFPVVGLNARRGLQCVATAELEEYVPWGLGDAAAGWEGGREFGGPLALDSGLSTHPLLLSKSHVELGKSSNSKSIFPEKLLKALLDELKDDVRGLQLSLVLNVTEFEEVVAPCDANPRPLTPLTWPFRCVTDISGPPTLLLLLPWLLLLLFAQRLLECPESTLLLESWPPSRGVKLSLSLSWTRKHNISFIDNPYTNLIYINFLWIQLTCTSAYPKEKVLS